MNRSCGVLMHISSLPGDYSIGTFGKEARAFVDFLTECGFSWWQVLPFCMTDEYNSPYKSYSAFGGNPYFIDLPTLCRKGLLTEEEIAQYRQESPYLCEFDRLAKERLPLLALAASRVREDKKQRIADFLSEQPELAKAAEFLALRKANGDLPWQEWTVSEADPEELFFWQFIEYEFYHQWMSLKEYANSRGIHIIGDIPIYVATDSADVWANREEFQLDAKGYPSSVAGCPPDYFSEDGQLWGNPLYRWSAMKKNGFSWWRRRMEYMLTLFDGVRIDHFRGLESYWSIPATAASAKEGKWVKGPGKALVNMIREVADGRLIIAEDLGDITPEVIDLLKYSKFPGMRVLQFGFMDDKNSPHRPHNYIKNCVAYTGTHDNNTLLGYVWESDPVTRRRVFNYCNAEDAEWSHGCEMILKTVMASHADLAIFPIQDILVYGSDTRMNTPGTATNNWRYRITEDQLRSADPMKFKRLCELYARD
ncbi:MAG: 4-alpha-glucanotransferase [Clostridia bacterium]|nr:4-alpha-glucanotransferase [Clostridia bacterium]